MNGRGAVHGVGVALACFVAGCAGSGAPAPAPQAAQDAPGTLERSARVPDPRCDPASMARPLESYDAITDGHRFTLELVQDERGAWGPAQNLDMPLHHASMIAWSNPELLEPHVGRVVVVATGIGRTSIEHDPERHTWFATYAARIDHVCPLETIP